MFSTIADWWQSLVSVAAGLLVLLSLLAFWPKWKASELAKYITENKRLRAVLEKMTLEEEVKSSVINRLTLELQAAEERLIKIHDDKLAEIHRTDSTPRPAG
jgi:hypothetical protein